jgi:hypothetical protein
LPRAAACWILVTDRLGVGLDKIYRKARCLIQPTPAGSWTPMYAGAAAFHPRWVTKLLILAMLVRPPDLPLFNKVSRGDIPFPFRALSITLLINV